MCGINGLLYKNATTSIDQYIRTMNGRIFHRGPDDEGIYTTSTVGMGMRRLSIIDLSTGNQPMKNDDGDIIIVFNGEIYNYRLLRNQLEAENVMFRTQSDTEVILRLYEKYGESMLSKLNGMFAFSIHDKRRNIVLIARDRFGEKPLYYYHNDEKVVWASELKSIVSLFPELKQISGEALTLFFSLTYIPAPYSIYQSVYKLPPGHYIKFDTTTLSKELQKYWDINPVLKADTGISYEEAQRKIYDLMFESVEQRMIADVPLGSFLSGGVDSTIVAAVMAQLSERPVKTFSVGYENKHYDESDRARQIARHINADHHEYILKYDDLFDKIEQIVLNYDEPYADSSCLPTYFIASKAVQHVKVALTGDGGDEVFGGYNKYMLPHYRKLYQKYVPGFVRPLLHSSMVTALVNKGDSKSVLAKVRKIRDTLTQETVFAHFNIIALGFRQQQLDRLFKNNSYNYQNLVMPFADSLPKGAGDLSKQRYIDKQISLEGDMLVKVDRASMLCSLECRTPFLDHRLMEYTFNLPDKYLLDKGNKKRILKDTFEHLLPVGFFNAPKSGFEVPVSQWFRGALKAELLKTLNMETLASVNLFNPGYVETLVNEHISARADHGNLLWTLYCFVKWYKANID